MGHHTDDLFVGGAVIGGSPTSGLGNSAPMTQGVGPLGRIYCFDAVPAASGTTTTQNEIALSQNLPAGNLTLTANGTTTTAGVSPTGQTLVVLDMDRTVAFYSASDLSASTVTVYGYDRYGQAVSQTITAPNATTVQTTKTFKSVYQITSSGAVAHPVVAGLGTVIGLPFRLTDLGYVVSAMYNQTAITINSTNIVVADTTSPATASTNDVRGTVLTGATDGTKRLVVNYMLPAIASGPNATRIGAVGVTQA